MRKWIMEHKWDRLYDACSDGLQNEDGLYTPENFFLWMERVHNLPDYQIIGIRHFAQKLKDSIKEYKLRHLCIGKVKFTGKALNEFHIEKISWDVHWQTNVYLAAIIRDYLHFFSEKTPVIGNCIIENKDPLVHYSDEELAALTEKWQSLLRRTAEEFNELIDLEYHAETDEDYMRREELTEKAFQDLAFIFHDLEW